MRQDENIIISPFKYLKPKPKSIDDIWVVKSIFES